MPPPRFFLLLPLLICCSAVSDESTALYTRHCASTVPESSPTSPTFLYTLPRFTTSRFAGGQKLFGVHRRDNFTYYLGGRSLSLRVFPRCDATVATGTYKVDGSFSLVFSRRYYDDSYRVNATAAGGSYYPRRRVRMSIRFSLTGFWSEESRKLCMVGSAASTTEAGEALTLQAVLKIKYYAGENQTITSSAVSGSLESTSPTSTDAYFDPISLFDFPVLYNYTYSVVSKEIRNLKAPRGKFFRLGADKFCNVLQWRPIYLEMAYASDCNKLHDCSPLSNGAAMPQYLTMNPIQCSDTGRRIRYTMTFQNDSYYAATFNFESTLIAEATWDDKTDQLYLVACRISSPIKHFDDAVGDCTLRLSLQYPSILTIRDRSVVVGQLVIMSTMHDNEMGYFRRIKLWSSDSQYVVDIAGQQYEYTELERAGKACSRGESNKEEGNAYPDGKSYDMRFDMSVKDLKGQQFASGYATPLFVGNEPYAGAGAAAVLVDAYAPTSTVVADADVDGSTKEEEKKTEAEAGATAVNISYSISIDPYWGYNLSARIGLSLNSRNQVEITAEGVYNASTGKLCMVGCRNLQKNSTLITKDCQILVKFSFAPFNARTSGQIVGMIVSNRSKEDPLYFSDMILSSNAGYIETAEASVWRMDMEITLVLVSNTLFCIFVGLQIFHVKRNPDVVSCISLAMVSILFIGYMIPLVLNVEAVFSENHNKQTVFLSSGGWLEANEVAVRVIAMVAFLLQLRLLQLVWTAKQGGEGDDKKHWIGERKAAAFALPLYALGALLTLFLNWMRNGFQAFGRHGYQRFSLWGDLRSYAGLILDSFLLPQIVLNAVRGSAEKALSHPFYIGISAVRLVPHAYDQYRAHSYPAAYVNGTYYYANPGADLYSTSWDVVIPLGVIAMAVMVFLQQRRGGRCILPRRFREVELYAKVPTADNE